MESGRKKHANGVLNTSIMLSLVFSFGALGGGLLFQSQVMFFDGIFTLLTTFLTYLTLLAIKFIRKKDFKNYPFGKESFEPLIVIGQYLLILVVSVMNILSAAQVIREGGATIDPLVGLSYGLLSMVFSTLSMFALKHFAGEYPTPSEELEIEQWLYTALFGIAIFIGFGVALLLVHTSLAPYVNYVDPILTILLTLAFMKTAVTGIRDCVKELMSATPPRELTTGIVEKINLINSHYHYLDMVFRLGKVGGQLIIEIDYVIEYESQLDSVRLQDQLREEIDQTLAEIPYDKWINVNFIGDIKWAD